MKVTNSIVSMVFLICVLPGCSTAVNTVAMQDSVKGQGPLRIIAANPTVKSQLKSLGMKVNHIGLPAAGSEVESDFVQALNEWRDQRPVQQLYLVLKKQNNRRVLTKITHEKPKIANDGQYFVKTLSRLKHTSDNSVTSSFSIEKPLIHLAKSKSN